MKLSPPTLAFLIAATVVLLVVFSSCKAGKDIIKTEYIRDSTVEEQLKKYVQKLTIELDNSEKRVKELEEENARLKRMYANLAMELDVAKYIIEKKL